MKQKKRQKDAQISQNCSKIEARSFQNPKPLYDKLIFSGHSTLVGFTPARLTSVHENLEGNIEIIKIVEIALVNLPWVRLTSVQENRGGTLDAASSKVDAFGVNFGEEI